VKPSEVKWNGKRASKFFYKFNLWFWTYNRQVTANGVRNSIQKSPLVLIFGSWWYFAETYGLFSDQANWFIAPQTRIARPPKSLRALQPSWGSSSTRTQAWCSKWILFKRNWGINHVTVSRIECDHFSFKPMQPRSLYRMDPMGWSEALRSQFGGLLANIESEVCSNYRGNYCGSSTHGNSQVWVTRRFFQFYAGARDLPLAISKDFEGVPLGQFLAE